mgnify:CR=1 FL=1
MKRKWVIGLVLLILLLAFALRLFPLRIYHWWDETVYLQNAETIFFGADNYDELAFRPPLLSIIFGLGFLFYHSVVTASILIAILNALGIVFIYLIGAKL